MQAGPMRRWWWRRWWWWQQLWIVAVLPLPALQAEEPSHGGGPIKHLNATNDGALHTTALPGNGASRTWSTPNTPESSSAGGRANETTPPRPTERSRPEKKTRTLLGPAIAVSSGNGACNVTLHCIAMDGGVVVVNYTWLDSETKVVLATEPTLQITQRPPDGSLDFTCVVRNEESENASRVSLVDRCHDSPLSTPGSSAAVYAKYLIPSVAAVILLLFLFAMYRRKKGIAGSHSQTVSINESSDSDEDGYTATARRSFAPEAFTAIPEETLQTTEALTSCRDTEIPETPDQPSSQE